MIRNRCPLRFRNGVVDDSRQWQAGTLAQVAEKRMHSTGDAAVAGRCKTPDSTVCGPIQLSPAAQRDRLRDAEGQAYIQRSESPRSPEESLYLGTRAAMEGSPSVRQSAAH